MEKNKKEVLRCENLKKSFYIRRKEFPVLMGINLSLTEGAVTVISGKSGTGKTTLISLLGGLEPPTEGSIYWQGKQIGAPGNKNWAVLRRNRIGIIFQDYNLITSWTAFENVEAPLLFSGIPEDKRRSMVEDIMKKLDILSIADHKPAEMSEGQQQRVAIARTIIVSPILILADEPTGGVDDETGDIITTALLSMVRDNKSSLLITTHSNVLFNKIANFHFILDRGILHSA
ncbi:MAG TPA: ATP-binding cassette domain-containing protein [bacterium]|nr:ATP-binding cassette domain-containing protein [bacterium]HPP29994.1 ATP-binding cassette domain-containing protein [bacterium]